MVIVYAICHRVGESPVGRVLKGIREDPVATQALGKNVFGYKVVVFGLTSALAAFAGAMLAAWFRLSTPGVFGFSFSLTVFAIVIFGGMGNLNGTILGAAVVVLLEPVLERVIKIDPAKAGYLQLIVYGVLLAVLMRVRPQGALPEGFSLMRWFKRRAWRQGAHRDGPRLGAGQTVRNVAEHIDAELPIAEENRRERAWHEAPVVLADVERVQALRRHRRRQRARHRAAQGHDHRPGRPQRCRQDDGVQPAHGRHPARLGLDPAQRRGAHRPRSATASPARAWSARSRTCACSTGCRACRT